MIDPVLCDARRYGEVMWGGGNADSQFGVVDDSPDCLQPRSRETLVDVRFCEGVHIMRWGGVGARELLAF